ncbi:MAG: hypothetical protein NTY64_12510 [Deltaproteobacteria bacterium]|nr:hypothetical protein [Deltaproteobacteria bacterium]
MKEKDPLSAENAWESIAQKEEEPAVPDEDGESIVPQEFLVETENELPPEQAQSFYQQILKMNVPKKLRLALFGNRMVRNHLIRDKNKAIALTVLRNAKLTESEVLGYASQRNLPDEVLAMISKGKHQSQDPACCGHEIRFAPP